MTPEEQLRVLDETLTAISGENSPASAFESLLHTVLLAMGESTEGVALLRPQISRIFELIPDISDAVPLYGLLRTQTRLLIPSGITEQQAFRGVASDWTKIVEQVWHTSSRSSLIDISVTTRLDDNLIGILAPLVYKSADIRALVANWLLSKPNSTALPALSAILEAASVGSDYIPSLVHAYSGFVLDGLVQAGSHGPQLYETVFQQLMAVGGQKTLERHLCSIYSSARSLQCLPFLGRLSFNGLLSPEAAIEIILPSIKPLVAMLARKETDEGERKRLMRAIGKPYERSIYLTNPPWSSII